MDQENTYRQEQMQKYRTVLDGMFRYIPWLMQKRGQSLVSLYAGENEPSKSIPIPVFDSTLLGFVKEMQGTGLMDRNYVYIFSKNGIRTVEDELRWIDEAQLQDMEIILGIIAKYVLGGMTKGRLWSEGVENGVFLQGLLKIKELLDVWDKPLA